MTETTGEFLTLGRYQLEPKPFATGGMGEVYRAFDPNLKRVIAIKVIDKAYAEDKGYRNRFRREALVMAKIGGAKGIVTVHDVGLGYTLWIAMEYLQGITYASKRMPRMNMEAFICFAKSLSKSLAFAHKNGIVHCDIKPSNIFCENGRPVLIDWGLGFSEFDGDGEAMQRTKHRGAHGTAPYVSPEQLMGDPSYPSDVYSFGATLFHIMTGEIPFKGNSVAMANQHANAERPSVLKLRPNAPFWIDALIRSCMAIDPKLRPTFKEILSIIKSKQTQTSSMKMKSVAIHPSFGISDKERLKLVKTYVVHDRWNPLKLYDFILIDIKDLNEISKGKKTNQVDELFVMPRKKILVLTDRYEKHAKIAKVAKFKFKAKLVFENNAETVKEQIK